MNFVAVLDQVSALLRQRGQMTYRPLQRQFQLDEGVLEDLKEELIYGQRLAVDEDDRVLVWTGARETTTPVAVGLTKTASPTPLVLATTLDLLLGQWILRRVFSPWGWTVG